MIDRIYNFIGGHFVPPRSDKFIKVYEPATGMIYAEVSNSNSNDIEDAYTSAESAFPSWSKLPIQKRAEFLNRIADGIESRIDEFAEYESRDTGKPIALARAVDIPRAISNFRFFASYGPTFKFEGSLDNKTSQNKIIRSPLGVVGCISPWNLPLYLFTWKIVPALIMGNTVIAKPSEITPFTAYMLGQICKNAFLPKGVINIIHGSGQLTGNPLVAHPKIKAISFTGGTLTGASIAKKAAPSFKKVSLEMGGKNPAIIFEDCDYKKMLETIVRSSFSNQGQICLCSSRLLIEDSIYEKFKLDFVEKVSDLVIGDPENIDTQFGSISSRSHFKKILNYIEKAKKEGARILSGGNSIKFAGRCKRGWFIEPTVIEGLDNLSVLNQEEIFGPVVTLQSFRSEGMAIKIANEIDYGLSATIWTKDKEKGQRLANKIDAGVIWVNCWMVRDLRTPFGGMKRSGLGREGGEEALKFFTEQKNICTAL